MPLLVVLFAAIFASILWYKDAPKNLWRFSTLCYYYWGASLMWLVDAAFEYAEQKAEFFTPALSDMLNDAVLGFAAVALGLLIWLANLIVKDPKRVIRP